MPELPKIVISKLVAGNVRPEDLQDAHPDPDLLTAFVEHTLPERERTVLLGHLAQCSPCREIIALAQPGEAEMQVVAGVARPRVRGWFLRWGVLAACAAVAVSAVVLRTNSRRETPLVAKQEAPAPMAESRASAKASSEVNKSASAAPVAGKSPRDEADVQPALGVAKSASAPQEREDVDKKELGEFRTRKVAPTLRGPSPMINNAYAMNNNAVVGGSASVIQNLPLNGRKTSQMVDLAPGVAMGSGYGTGTAPAAAAKPSEQAAAATWSDDYRAAEADSVQDKLLKAKKDSGARAKEAEKSATFGAVTAASVGAVAGAAAKSAPAFAPVATPGQQAEIKGLVVDPSGAVVSDAKVTVTNAATGATVASSTNTGGVYDLAPVPAGSYTITVSKAGFREFVRQGVNVGASTVALNATLQVGMASETVEVATASSTVDDTSSTVPYAPNAKGEFRASSAAMSVNGLIAARAAATWQVTDAGNLQRSFDGGKSWESVSVNPPTPLRVVATTGFQVWAGGNGGALFHSYDAGGHFVAVQVQRKHDTLTGDIVALAFKDAHLGRIETADHEVWTTSDGGKSWRHPSGK